MNYSEAVEYIHSLRHFEKDPSLKRMSRLTELLGNPQDKLQFIHVAGTNGKGSVCFLLYNVLKANGVNAGLYTSPYIEDFRERFQTADEGLISEAELAYLTEKIKCVTKENGLSVNEFEFITALAFCFFAQKGCKAVVLETGLGGRFDSTNIIKKPLVSVITSISLDHTAILGNTVEEIATEKSGIIKAGCPVVTSMNQNPDALQIIIREAAQKGCELLTPNPNAFEIEKRTIHTTELLLGSCDRYILPLIGNFQLENLAVVLECVRILNRFGFLLDNSKVKAGIKQTVIPARMECVCEAPAVIIDGSHNPDGIANAFNTLKQYGISSNPIVVYAGMRDKAYEEILAFFKGRVKKLILTAPDNIRAESPYILKEAADMLGIECEIAEQSRQSLELAFRSASDDDTVFVCGSFFLAGEVRSLLKK